MRLALFVTFLAVTLTELAIIIQVQQAIGLDWTLLVLIAVSIAGAVLVKREGGKAWRRFWDALGAGRMPTEEVVDGALLLFAGALLLTPGFLTDGVGLALLVPATRGIANRALRTRVRGAVGLGPARRRGGAGADEAGDTIDVEVVDVRRDDAPPAAGEPGRLEPGGSGRPGEGG
jgi:UPF0716 protein FxsA